MAKLSMNSDDLLTSIKSRALIPTAQNAFSNDDLLNFATEELNLKLVPCILSVREEFYVTDETVPLVANQSNYKIPYRAIGGRLRYVYHTQNDGRDVALAQLNIEDLIEYQGASASFQSTGFYVQNDEIILVPSITGAVNGSLKYKYYLKPNSIVDLTRGARITAINTSNGQITVASVPSNITASSEVDFIGSTGNFKTKGFDIVATNVNSTTKVITVAAADIPSDLAVGDYICTAGESVIPQIPSELQVMLAQAVACRVLEALGDTQGLQNANAKLTEMEQKLVTLIDSRVEAPSKKVVNRNSLLRNRRYSY
jgi:hypothetical protein